MVYIFLLLNYINVLKRQNKNERLRLNWVDSCYYRDVIIVV